MSNSGHQRPVPSPPLHHNNNMIKTPPKVYDRIPSVQTSRSCLPLDLDTPVPLPRKSLNSPRGKVEYYNLTTRPPAKEPEPHYDQLRPSPVARKTVRSVSPPVPKHPPPLLPPDKCAICNDVLDVDHKCESASRSSERVELHEPLHHYSSPREQQYDTTATESAYNEIKESPLRPSTAFIQELSQAINSLNVDEEVNEKTDADVDGNCGLKEQQVADRISRPGSASASRLSDADSHESGTVTPVADEIVKDVSTNEPIYSNILSLKNNGLNTCHAAAVLTFPPPPPIPPRNTFSTTDSYRSTTPSEYSSVWEDTDVYSDFGTFQRVDSSHYSTCSSASTTTGAKAQSMTLVSSSSGSSCSSTGVKQIRGHKSPETLTEEPNSSRSGSTCADEISSSDDDDQNNYLIRESIADSLAPLITEKRNNGAKSGFLYKSGPSRNNLQKRWFKLDSSAISYYKDDPVSKNGVMWPASPPTGVIYCKNIDLVFVSDTSPLHVQAHSRLQRSLSGMSVKSSPEGDSGKGLFYFEIGVNCEKEKGRQYLLAAENEEDGRDWIKCLTISLVPNLLRSYIHAKRVDAVGSIKMRTFVSGIVTTAWIVLAERCLFFVMDTDECPDRQKHPEIPPSVKSPCNKQNKQEVQTIDLRKVVSVSLASPQKVSSMDNVLEAGQPICIQTKDNMALYLQSNYRVHTDSWFRLLFRQWTLPHNASLSDQYLTAENVPVAVDKCLNFICTYGGLRDKGIYRLNGHMSTVRTIYDSLKGSTKIWDLHLVPEDGIHAHDVASAFKLFMRSFSECILTDRLLEEVLENNQVEDSERRLRTLKSILRQLPIVNYCTLKRIISHMVRSVFAYRVENDSL